MREEELRAKRNKAIEKDRLSIENRLAHAFNQGYETGRQEVVQLRKEKPMKVGEEYMWVVDGFAYPRRVVIKTKPDPRGYVKVRCYDNDGRSYTALANVKDLKKQAVIDISQKGESMWVNMDTELKDLVGKMDDLAKHLEGGVTVDEKDDPVSHPSHYTSGSIECIDAMEAAFGRREVITFSKLNAFKYIWRAELKNNELQDLEKAAWYLNKAIELLKEEAESGMEKENLLKFDRCYCDY